MKNTKNLGFCNECGSKLILAEPTNRFDPHTGKRILTVRCSTNRCHPMGFLRSNEPLGMGTTGHEYRPARWFESFTEKCTVCGDTWTY